MKNTLHKLAYTCLNTPRERVLTSTNYEGLTIISSRSSCGKNTLLAGIMSNTDKEETLLVLTETSPYNATGMIKSCASLIQDYREFDIDNVLFYLEQTTHENIFIEQYNNLASDEEKLNDLIKLKTFCRDTGRNIYMCVYNRKEKGGEISHLTDSKSNKIENGKWKPNHW